MPGRDLRLGLRLTADGRGFRGEVRLSRRDLDRLTSATKRSGAAAREASRRKRELARRQRELDRTTKAATASIVRFSALLGGAGGVALLGRWAVAAARVADANVDLDNRLRLITDSESELIGVRNELLDLSNRTFTSLDANAVLYSRVALATKNVSISESDRLRVIELLNKQVQIGGSNTAEATAGLIQFAQGLASGRLQGDELRSVLENLLGVQQGLIAGFAEMRRRGEIDFDVTRANIRQLASEGKLSSELLIRAVLASADDTEAAYEQVQVGIGRSFQLLRNEIRETFREGLDEAGGFTATLVQGIARNLAEGRQRRDVTERAVELFQQGPISARDFIGVTDEELEAMAESFARELEDALQVVDPDSIIGRRLVASIEQRLAEIEREQTAREADVPLGDEGAGLSRLRAQLAADAAREDLAEARAGRVSAQAREFLRIERDLLGERARIEASYEHAITVINRYAGALDDGGVALRRAAASERDLALAAVRRREAIESGEVATAAAAAALAELRAETDRLASGEISTLEQLEREREQRELILRIIREHGDAAPDVVGDIITETLRRRELVEVMELQAAASAQLLDRVVAATPAMKSVTTDTESQADAQKDLQEALSVTGESLRRITGSLGQFAGQSRRAFRFQQAASLATAIVSTAEGVTRALAKDPPLSFVLAGLVAAAGAAQIAAIRAQQPPTAFQYGGIIDRRTEFGYGGGQRGVAGEAGLEAILPLARNARGELGVRGSAGGHTTLVIDVGGLSVTVQAPEGTRDPEGFARAAAPAIRSQIEPMVIDIMRDQQRPGGVSNPTTVVG